jgi:hypothetical protein
VSTVIDFPSDLDSEIIKRFLHRAGIQDFILIGYDRDGVECVVSDLESGADILWHLRRTEHKLMGAADGLLVRDEDGPAA